MLGDRSAYIGTEALLAGDLVPMIQAGDGYSESGQDWGRAVRRDVQPLCLYMERQINGILEGMELKAKLEILYVV